MILNSTKLETKIPTLFLMFLLLMFLFQGCKNSAGRSGISNSADKLAASKSSPTPPASTPPSTPVDPISPDGIISSGANSSAISSGAIATVPGRPIIRTAVSGKALAIVNFTPPTSTGGATISSYIVTSNPGSKTSSGSSSPITVAGLTNGTAYTFTVQATNSVGISLASDASNSIIPTSGLTVPGPPIIGAAIAGNALATVNFTPPSSDGGATISSYTVTSNPGSKTASGSSSPISVSGLTNGTAYNFTVKATNSVGLSLASGISNSVTPAVPLTVPGPPTIGTPVAGNASVTINFTPPASNGGVAISSYTATSNPGSKSASATSAPITVSGLTNGTTYTFTVKATNSVGTSLASSASTSIAPSASLSCTFNGTSVAVGSGTLAYSKATVPYPLTCASVSESRNCLSKDNLSGTFTFSSCMVPSATRPSCAANTTYCIHNSVNNLVYPQDTNLIAVYPAYTGDKGYCGAASATMILSIMQAEGIATTDPLIRDFPATIIDQAIYYTGNKVATNWSTGGTNSDDLYNKIFSPLAASYPTILSATMLSQPITTSDITTPFLAKMAVQNFIVMYGKISTGVYSGGHALMVKGFENGAIKIWDPWNRIYNVKIEAGVPKVQSTGTGGMIESYASQNVEVYNVQAITVK